MSDSGNMGQLLGLAMKTHCAILLVYYSSGQEEAVIATAFAARLPNPNTSGEFDTLIFASNPKVDNDFKYYTKLSNGDRLNFQQCDGSFSGVLFAKPSQQQQQILQLVVKCLELDEPLAIAGNGTLKKIYVAQANSEVPKKYVVEKMAAHDDGKYRLVSNGQKCFDQNALFVGAPIVNCYSNLLNYRTTKKLVGMIKSISSAHVQDGTTFLVVEFTDAFVHAILNGYICVEDVANSGKSSVMDVADSGKSSVMVSSMKIPEKTPTAESNTCAGGTKNVPMQVSSVTMPESNSTTECIGRTNGVAATQGISMGPTQSEVEKINDLDQPTRQKMCRKLNVPRTLGGDFRSLAGLVGIPNDEIHFLATKDSPAEHVLLWWDGKPNATVAQLRDYLKRMERGDLLEILDNRPRGNVRPSETSDQA